MQSQELRDTRRIGVIWLCLILVFSTGFIIQDLTSEGKYNIPTPFAGGSFGGGSGTIWAPYIIEDVDDLQNMTANLSAHYVLGGDIDATITSTWNGGEGFMPIGNLTTKFTGSLNGQNHTINGLFIDRSTNYVGLFGIIGTGSKASYISLIDNEINGVVRVGGFAGQNSGTIMNCLSTGSISGSFEVGGFVGFVWDSTIINCYSTGDISGSQRVGGFAGMSDGGTITSCHSLGDVMGTGDNVGGFIGWNLDGTIKNCYSVGDAIGGDDAVGGFVGYGGGATGTIMNCYSAGDANGDQQVGGFAGWNWAAITNSYSTGNAIGTGDYVGGFLGESDGGGSITNCYSTGNAAGNQRVGGFIGYNIGSISNSYSSGSPSGGGDVGGFAGYNHFVGIITNCFWDTQTSGQGSSDGGTGKTTAEMMTEATFTGAGWDFTNIWFMVDTETRPFLRMEYNTSIRNSHQLQLMIMNVNADYMITNDFNMDITEPSQMWGTSIASGGGFVPIGDGSTTFSGSLDGQNHTIIGLYINRITTMVGLFGYMGTGSSAKDLRLSGIEINGDWDVGSFVGWNWEGTITNCHCSGNITGDTRIGCFVGYNYGSISDCSSIGSTTGIGVRVGGFVGNNLGGGTITNCSSIGNVSSTTNLVGGFVGINSGTITNCHSTGNATGNFDVGGFAGRNDGSIMKCFCTGNAIGGGWQAAGFAGRNTDTITNCYSRGNASGTGAVAGFVGRNAGGAITNCYSIGNASGTTTYVGGFAGMNEFGGTFSDCFWDTETSGWATSAGGTGKTTAEMMQQATFTNWDFTTIWGIIEGYTYPYFQPRDSNLPLSVKLPLSEGWNLLSLPVTQSSENLDDILKSIDGKWDYIQVYDAIDVDHWKTNATFKPDKLNDLKSLNHKIGFWINITEPNVTLTVFGKIPTSTNIPLYAGWNLVGYPSLTNETVANALWGTGADKVEVCDPAEPYHIKEVGPSYLMKPGDGYWVHVPADTVWVVDW